MIDGTIYVAYNLDNMKVYVGKTTKPLCQRKRLHKHSAFKKNVKTYFYNALRKYGWDKFRWRIVDTYHNDQEGIVKEQEWIAAAGKDINMSYNLRDESNGGDTSMFFTEEGNTRRSVASKKLWTERYDYMKSLVQGEKNPMYGCKHTEESKRQNRMNQPMLGKKQDPEKVKMRIQAMMDSPKWRARFNKG